MVYASPRPCNASFLRFSQNSKAFLYPLTIPVAAVRSQFDLRQPVQPIRSVVSFGFAETIYALNAGLGGYQFSC